MLQYVVFNMYHLMLLLDRINISFIYTVLPKILGKRCCKIVCKQLESVVATTADNVTRENLKDEPFT